MKVDHANLFFRQLAAMTASGMSLTASIRALAEEEQAGAGRIISEMRQEIDRGAAPGETMIKHIPYLRGLSPSVFNGDPGAVSGVLREIAEFSEKRQTLRRFMILSLVYPAVLVTVLLCVLALLMIVVIPMFSAMYADIGSSLPLPTRILIVVSRYFWLFGSFIPVGLLALAVIARKKPLWLYAAADKVPVINMLNRKIAAAEFLRNLSVMAALGPLSQDALHDASGVSNDFHALKLRESARGNNGILSLMDSAGRMGLIPPMVRQTLRAGEKSGTLPAALRETARFMEQEAEKMYNRFVVFLHPALIIVLGSIIGFCIIALYLPIFQMGTTA